MQSRGAIIVFAIAFALVCLFSRVVNISLEMKMAEKSDDRIPMISVVAKPCTGPVPNM